MSNIFSVNIIGSGNVAHYMAKVFIANNVKIKSVYSRNVKHAEAFASLCKSRLANSISDLDSSADLYFIAASDYSIAEISNSLKVEKPIVHTSGITSLKVLSDYHQNAGVFYPLQTLTKESIVLPKDVPVLLEASNAQTLELLTKLSLRLGFKSMELSSEKRQYLHLAAVFVNNFGNHLASIAKKIADEQQIPFDLLKPLILETANKLQLNAPSNNQTGPAKRNDLSTIETHLHLLENEESILELYKLFSADILKTYSE